MGKYFDMLMEDVRFREGLNACMNCGVCTGVCPAAEFYNYDPAAKYLGRNGKYIGKPGSAVVNGCPPATLYDMRE